MRREIRSMLTPFGECFTGRLDRIRSMLTPEISMGKNVFETKEDNPEQADPFVEVIQDDG
jgi:hypothetical protein